MDTRAGYAQALDATAEGSIEVAADVRIRPAVADDVDVIAALNAALFREDAGQHDPSRDQGWPQREGRSYFGGVLADQRCICYLAVCGDDAVGYLVGRLREGGGTRPLRLADLESMYVQERFRSQGVGAHLVARFLGWAGQHGADRAAVQAYAANERAIGFYHRIGFRPMVLSLELGIRPEHGEG